MSIVKCGIIMPISEINEYTEEHWEQVKNVIKKATEKIEGYRIECDLVSGTENIGVIHSEIVQNIQNSEIIICDVSGNNPNVMFELGLRLALNKPTIVIKDNVTDYIFDISPIHHVEYDKNLNIFKMEEFIDSLSTRIEKELSHTQKNRNTYYNSFSIYSEKKNKEINIFDSNLFDDDERLFFIYIKEKENYIFNNMDVVPQDLILWEKENNLKNFISEPERYKLILKKLFTKEFFKITNNPLFEESDYILQSYLYKAIKENIKNYPEKVNGLKIKYSEKEDSEKISPSVLNGSIKLYLTRNSSKSNKTINATALFNSKGYLVLKGSEIELIDSSSISPKIEVARKKAKINDQGILQEDVLFTSPSSAAGFVVGGYTNGRLDWKNEDGKTLKEIQEKNDSDVETQ